MKKHTLSIRKIALLSILSAILIVQKIILGPIPFIQLVFFLIIFYTSKISFKSMFLVILIYVLVDGISTSSLNLTYTPYIFLGLILIPLTMNTIFKNIKSPLGLSLIGILHAFIYSWIFIIPMTIIYEIDILLYLYQDILYELALALSTFLTTIILYQPLSNFWDLKLNDIKL
ncbi:hypothetical protein [Acholeplasma granularum]|uniref:hypothetical protein n=1 Tax=Acholeplasma granularum TaxID=264635 RepID=UPI00046F4AC7|nr:hypothetical protein [Acholeplasma granularum]